MRILLIQAHSFFPSVGGADKSDRLMIAALARRGHTCRVIARLKDLTQEGHDDYLRALAERSITPSRVKAGVVIFELESVEVNVATTADVRSYALEQLKEFDPDVILVSTDPLNVLIGDLTRVRTAKVVYLVRTTMLLPFGPDSAFPSKAKTEAIRQADSVVTVSHYLANYVLEYSGISAIHLPIQMMEADDWPTLGILTTRS